MNPNADLDLDLADFDSPLLAPRGRAAGLDYLDQMWSRGRTARHGHDAAKDAITAHSMVQTFVNAFSRGGRYRVTFDENIGTAGTNLETRDVLITPAPVLDPTIDAQRAGRILTGLSCHEISHPRYDTDTAKAVRQVFSNSGSADHCSNVLSDVRIERRFIEDYPGYEGIFDPTLEYVGDSMVKDLPNRKMVPSLNDQLNLMTMAVRFPDYADWSAPDADAERVWWQDWRDRWSHEDSPRRHVAAIREALRHIVDTSSESDRKDREKNGQPSGQQRAGGGAPGSQKDEEDLRQGSGKALGQSADRADQSDLYRGRRNGEDRPRNRIDPCTSSKAVDKASGVDEADITAARSELQREVTQGEEVQQVPDGTPIDVAESTRGLEAPKFASEPLPIRDPAAARFIRDALLRSRTGHTDTVSHQRHGRLDQKGLHRIASRDVRIFEKRRASSPGKYLVWLMLDTSSSMNSAMASTAQVAMAIADATQHVPTVRAEAWAWSSSYRGRGMAGVARLWRSGMAVTEIARVVRLLRGGTPDAPVLQWATEAILREARNGETPVIIFCSDGDGQPTMADSVAAARARGIDVRSVALGSGLSSDKQRGIYGEGNFVPWMGTMLLTARPLGQMIARIVSTARAVTR